MTTDSGKIRLGVIFGGQSGEHEVSLMSARSVLAAIDPARYAVTQIGITHDGAWLSGPDVLDAFIAGRPERLSSVALLPDPTFAGLYGSAPVGSSHVLELLTALDVVFPVLHGTFGEDGALQGLFELAGLAYVGAGVLGSAVGMDKGVFKSVMRAAGIPVVDWIIANRSEIERDPQAVIDRAQALGEYPLFVKPANLGSSVGITRCNSGSDLLEGLYEAARFDRRVLVERGVTNPREIEISVLGNADPQASLPGEIRPSREFYSYEAKYIDGASELIIPAGLPPGMTEDLRRMALQAYRAIDCAGMARVDFLLERDAPGRLYLGEVNTIPGFTQISMYPKLWEHSGLPYPQLIDRLVELAMERHAERSRTERRYRREDG
ncbi:MAG: D-alanine--D-alanine ligase family protein [Chloroflexota bacterium]